MQTRLVHCLAIYLAVVLHTPITSAQNAPKQKDAKNTTTGKTDPVEDPAFQQFGIYAATAPRHESVTPKSTVLPLELEPGARIALIGNMLLERSQYFGQLETLLHQRFPNHQLVVRNLGWPADAVDLQPRPDNFADVVQHLYHEKTDVVFAAFGFNESFGGVDGLPAFRDGLRSFIANLKSSALNGITLRKSCCFRPLPMKTFTVCLRRI